MIRGARALARAFEQGSAKRPTHCTPQHQGAISLLQVELAQPSGCLFGGETVALFGWFGGGASSLGTCDTEQNLSEFLAGHALAAPLASGAADLAVRADHGQPPRRCVDSDSASAGGLGPSKMTHTFSRLAVSPRSNSHRPARPMGTSAFRKACIRLFPSITNGTPRMISLNAPPRNAAELPRTEIGLVLTQPGRSC
jgi:hypothetical protein